VCVLPVTQLMVNSQVLFTLRFQQPNADIFGCHSRSRSIIVSLNVNDRVYITMPNNVGGCLEGDTKPLKWFVGMRLY
jgi:hypothetical protein